MAAYTKEQFNLIRQIRGLLQREQEGNLSYSELVWLGELQEQANAQNLCWW